MEGSAFDRLARAVATSGTRRRLLAFLSALPVVGLLPAVIVDLEWFGLHRGDRLHLLLRHLYRWSLQRAGEMSGLQRH